MSTPESFQALRRANPRNEPGFPEAVESAASVVRAEIATASDVAAPGRSRRRLLGLSAAAAALAAAAVIAYSTAGSSGVQSASAAFEQAATLTAASAERSGTAVVRVTHDGKLWTGSTIRWNGDDIAVRSDLPDRNGRPGSALLVVDGVVYGVEDGRWLEMGSPENIDPDSGTTPGETLAAVREDVGGTTLRRITDGMTRLSTRTLDDGSTVYSGAVPARLIARETGFKEGQAIRVLPFGSVAQGEAANPAALLDTAVTVGSDGIVRKLAVEWGTWTYAIAYSKLGEGAAVRAPANAIPMKEWRRLGLLTR
jgi:hypothetical protein